MATTVDAFDRIRDAFGPVLVPKLWVAITAVVVGADAFSGSTTQDSPGLKPSGQLASTAWIVDEPLNARASALEGAFLYWFGRQYAASAYIEKWMFAEAVAESRQAQERSGVSARRVAFLGYALTKSGKRAEARVELERLLRLSTERYVSPYNIAMIYHGLGERETTFKWLERGYQQREPRMVFLKVEPKWAQFARRVEVPGLTAARRLHTLND